MRAVNTIQPDSTFQSAIHDIGGHILRCGGPSSLWYCGIAANPLDRLFNDHHVEFHVGPWIYRDCGTDEEAREVERYLLALGCQGGRGGGDYSTRFVYAYRITLTTRE